MANIIIWEDFISLFKIENNTKIACPKDLGTPGPPNHVNYYVLKFGGLGYHLGGLNVFAYDSQCKGN